MSLSVTTLLPHARSHRDAWRRQERRKWLRRRLPTYAKRRHEYSAGLTSKVCPSIKRLVYSPTAADSWASRSLHVCTHLRNVVFFCRLFTRPRASRCPANTKAVHNHVFSRLRKLLCWWRMRIRLTRMRHACHSSHSPHTRFSFTTCLV
jgi:hypothetical protein